MQDRPPVKTAAFFILSLSILACDLPRDADGTLERVRGGVLRAGYSENPPWVSDTAGVERRLIHELANVLGTRVEWVENSESELIEDLHDRKLDLAVGGLTADGTWITRAAPTRPFHHDSTRKKDHVWAAPPGENAWLVEVEKFLSAQRPRVPDRLAREAQ